MRVALAGCSSYADPDQSALVAALSRRGVAAEGVPWDADADWPSYDLVVVRSTWDYVGRRAAFLAWADSVPRLANPASVLRWNTDKSYLETLSAAGVPVVPTTYVNGAFEPPAGEYVVKPTISAGGVDTVRYRPGEEDAARAQVAALVATGRTAMVQPYVERVEETHETSLLFVGGRYSHAARKGPLLRDRTVAPPEQWDIGAREPSEAELAVASQVLGALAEPLLYARVDLLPGPDGPMLLELEATEPFLFLGFSEGAADRFAEAISAWS